MFTRAPTVIKKYSNRRLYNTEISHYIVLDDLALLLKQGEDFVVLDDATNDDITHDVLMQILLENESKKQSILPNIFIKMLINIANSNWAYILSEQLSRIAQLWLTLTTMNPCAFGADKASFFDKLAKCNVELFQNALQFMDKSK